MPCNSLCRSGPASLFRRRHPAPVPALIMLPALAMMTALLMMAVLSMGGCAPSDMPPAPKQVREQIREQDSAPGGQTTETGQERNISIEDEDVSRDTDQ